MAQIINNDHGSWWWQAESNNELTLAVITILVLILLLYKFLISSSSSSLSPFPPGPLSLPIVGYLPSLFSRDLHRQFTNMANTYGPVFKVKVGKTLFVVVNTPDVAKTVLRDHDEVFTHCKATVARSIISYGGQNIVHSNHLYWRKLRNILTHEVISHKSLEACSSFRRDEVRKTIKNIFNEMMGATVDMAKVSFMTEARIMSRVLWENTSDELGVKDSHFGDQLEILSAEISEIGARPNLSDLLPSLARFDPQGIERDMKEQFKRLDKIFSTIIDDRIKSNAASLEQADGKKDFLQVLLDLKDSKSLTLSQAKTLLADTLVVGTETVAAVIEWTMTEIIQNPNVMKRVQEELAQVVGMDNIVEESHVAKLKYLDATVKETLRLHPAGLFLVPRTPSQDCVLGGYTVPKGCTVLVNAWKIQRDPQYWDNPLEFNPDRFLTGDLANNKGDYYGCNMNFLPFGSGKRVCPAIPLAKRLQMYLLASLLHSFDWSFPGGEKPDLSEKWDLGRKKLKPLMVIPSQRLSSISLYM